MGKDEIEVAVGTILVIKYIPRRQRFGDEICFIIESACNRVYFVRYRIDKIE